MTDVHGIRLIAGLGNPGKKYEGTRHNVGFMVIDALAGAGAGFTQEFGNLLGGLSIAGTHVMMIKPQKYMNRSGGPVLAALKENALMPANLLVIHDDMDLPLGRLRFRSSGSAGGHRGVESIIETLGTDEFFRLKIGVGRPDEEEASDYVLERFVKSEEKLVKKVIDASLDAVRAICVQGFTMAATGFNGLKLNEDLT